MALTKQSALFAWRSDFGPDPLVGGDPVYVRDSAAWWFDGRIFRKSITGPSGLAAPRFEPVTLDGVQMQAMLLEAARTGQVENPNAFSVADGWTHSGAGTLIDVPSMIESEAGSKIPGGGSSAGPFVFRSAGVFTGSAECLVVIAERGTTNTHPVAVYDETLGTFVVEASKNWLNGGFTVTSGSGSVFQRKLADRGPNGGEVWVLILSYSGTGGNVRRVYGVRHNAITTAHVFLHHCNVDEMAFSTSPIAGPAGTVRSADSFHWKGPPKPQALASYGRVSVGHASRATEILFRLADTGNNGPRWGPATITANNALYSLIDNGVDGNVLNSFTVTFAVGDDLEFGSLLFSDGAMRLVFRRNGGTVQGRSTAAPASGLPSDWVNNAVLNVGGTGGSFAVNSRFGRFCIVDPADLDTDPSAGDATDLLDELAEYDYLTAPEA